jgi:hypothetical protein
MLAAASDDSVSAAEERTVTPAPASEAAPPDTSCSELAPNSDSMSAALATMSLKELRLRLQGWSPEAATATGKVAKPQTTITGSDVVAFGRWKGTTYREVLADHRDREKGSYASYASWVVAQSEEGESS